MCKKLLFISFISLLVFFSSASAAPLISDSDLVMYYDFDSIGATVADGSGQGNDATVVGNVVGYDFGRSGAGADFGGTSSDALDVTATTLADRPSSAVTIAAWCKIEDTDDHQSIFNAYGPKPSDPGSNAFLYHMEIRTGSDQYRWCVRNSEGETIGNIQQDAAVITGQWMHFACTYDSASADGNDLKIYINGDYLTGMPAGAVADLNIGTNWDSGAAIGYTADGLSRNYNGLMDEFYMFKRALSPAEISMLASASWLTNGGFETGDITGWTEWDASSEYGQWGEAGNLDVNTSKTVEIAPGMPYTLDAGQGDYACFIEEGNQYGIAQTVTIPVGTLVQVDALWCGTFIVGGQGWAEIKALNHPVGASYNMNESPAEYIGEEIMVAKTDTYGPLNEKTDQSWDWEDAPEQCPIDGDQFVSLGEVVLVTKFGGFTANRAMGVDNLAVTPLYSVTAAYDPVPETGHEFTWRDFNEVTLSWTPGYLAASHDVYLGTVFEDVNTATNASAEFMGNQAAASYVPTSLVPGNTYYWRVDEVNDTNLWKGDVWSFVYPSAPVTDDMEFWWKCDDGDGAVMTDSASGFDGTITNLGTYMFWEDEGLYFTHGLWSGGGVTFDTNDVTAAFSDFDKQVTCAWWYKAKGFSGNGDVFRLSDVENTRVLHAHAVTSAGEGHFMVTAAYPDLLYYWEIGNEEHENYIPLLDRWHHFAFTKDADSPFLKIYIDGELKVSVTNRYNWGGDQDGGPVDTPITGAVDLYFGTSSWHWLDGTLKDIRFYDRALEDDEVDALTGDFPFLAKGPSPEDEATDVALEGTMLQWEAGRGITSHRVYFGKDKTTVRNADTGSDCYMGEVATPEYDPGNLDLMETYYWRVDEVTDNGKVYTGEVWQFDSIQYVMVEDFEAYDDDGNDIGAVWEDTIGWGDIQITRADDPNVSPVNSMKLRYHVPYDPYYAIAARSFSPAQDWTVFNVKLLTINYYGTVGNFDLPVFVTIGDGTTDANVVVTSDTTIEGWQQINVPLPEIAAAGVDLTNVTYLEIGFGDGTNLGMSSSAWDVIYVDDISLYPPKCVLSESSLTADVTGDCVVDIDDLSYVTDGWLRGSSADAIAAANPAGLWLFDDDTDLLKATVGNDLTVGIYGGTGGTVTAVSGIAAGDGAAMVPLNTHLVVDHDIAPAAGETRVNEYTLLWEVNIPAASAYGPLRWVALGEYDVVDLTSDVDISVIYAKGGVSYDDGLVGTHQGWSADVIAPDTWYQIVASVKNGEFYRFYVNGDFVSETPAQAVDGRYSLDETFHIFKDNENEDPDINCSTFAIFDRALTAQEIKSLVPIQLLKGDLNADVAIDFADYSILADEWLQEDLWP